eukprot:CAMPEP_0182494020 /NCGR_PEP_ID=MMETSP1321-20130603/2918_1 /TAXON_ID=91990 /ORGANISM="Bolidomonas sp., Strain RCC1657" /LENGTH=53 /DNA_ID=CAMNT_0024696965 /DNA_START=343 /DNA_END=504 /DNA_ORIENTATION=-
MHLKVPRYNLYDLTRFRRGGGIEEGEVVDAGGEGGVTGELVYYELAVDLLVGG